MWSKQKPVSSTITSALVEKNFRDVKYGLKIPNTSVNFNYVKVDDWQRVIIEMIGLALPFRTRIIGYRIGSIIIRKRSRR